MGNTITPKPSESRLIRYARSIQGVMKIQNRTRNIMMNFRVTEAERDLIAEKMAAANIRGKESYLRKMALDGYVVRLDLADIRKMVQLLQNATNNLNQIAKRANETRSVYESDIKDLQEKYDRLWDSADSILRSMANVRK